METFELTLLSESPAIVLVVGDVNSTIACALVTKKTWCCGADGSAFIPKLAHVEAGLRSFDRTMPEEINRIVTDAISDYLFTTEESANRNLEREGVPSDRVHFVGNVMIDTLLYHKSKAERSSVLSDLELIEEGVVRPYAILTVHRPANVDDRCVFEKMLNTFVAIAEQVPVIFPAHPRTIKQIQDSDLRDYFYDYSTTICEASERVRKLHIVPPLGYLDFLQLMSHAKVVFTDSGGVQEETSMLGIPCITLRESTERPVTVSHGTNILVGGDPDRILTQFLRALNGQWQRATIPRLWDGQAAKRVVEILAQDHWQSPSRESFSKPRSMIGEGSNNA